jgi:molybdopterin-containing oxidoreductase family membrane subunit
VGWDFGMTLTPGWHSTIFAPYFVLGAIFSGLGAVVIAMSIVRWVFKLEKYLTPYHFDQLGKVLLAVSLLWGYFTFAENLTVWYGHDPAEMAILEARTTGIFLYPFLVMIFCNFIIPVSYLSFPKLRRNITGFFVVAVIINIGMFIERFLIIIPSLVFNRLPFNWGTYTPSWVEVSILIGSLALYILLYLIFVKVFPVLPMWEIKEGHLGSTKKKIGEATFPAIMKHD